MTDDTSIFQHAIYGAPYRADGYRVDDDARGLAAVYTRRCSGSIGAALQKDPSKVILRSIKPFVHPDPSRREGYVPKVVYICCRRHGASVCFWR